MHPLNSLDTNQIENVYLYVADDVRYDCLPDEIASLGVSTKLICDGQISPTSFSSIITGLHYPQHGVDDFDTRVPEDAPNLLHSSSHNTVFCNTINHPPFNDNRQTESILMDTLRTEDSPSDMIETVSPPFVLVERGRGGHSPYGDFDGSGSEYFRSRGDVPRHQIVDEYKRGVARDAEWFKSQLETLKERGLADNTLVVYTSDHGELLGEMGNFGHHGSMHRKLVEAPCVFIHPSLPSTGIRQEIVRHVDLLPTIQSAADIKLTSDIGSSGQDLLHDTAPEFGTCYYHAEKLAESSLPTMAIGYESVWDETGGYIIPTSSRVNRIAAAVWKLFRGPKAELHRRRPTVLMAGFWRGGHRSGTPAFSRDTAVGVLNEISHLDRPTPSDEILDVQKERLEELGYLE